MFDGEYAIIAEHSQSRDKFLPPFCTMSVAAGPEYPTAIAFIGIGFCIQHSGTHQISGIELSVLCMNVEDRVAQNPHCRNWVNSLPEHMTRIVVAPEGGACDCPEAAHRLRTINHEPRMHFDGDLDLMLRRKLCPFYPVWCYNFVPLPRQDIEIFGRPG